MSTFLIVGDFMVDRYLLATADRWSAEAPVPIWTVRDEFERPGGGANVSQNLIDLGERAFCMARMPYPIKTRVIVNGQQVARFDLDDKCYPPDLQRLENWANAEDIDGIIVSDYAKGAVDDLVTEVILDAGRPTFIDTKRDPSVWFPLGAKVWFFPNYQEFGNFESAYRRASQVILKRGAEGIARLEQGHSVEAYPAYAKDSEVVDVCGAGDTVISAFASKLLTRNPTEGSTPLRYANAAASVVVRKPYTSTATRAEIFEVLKYTLNA